MTGHASAEHKHGDHYPGAIGNGKVMFATAPTTKAATTGRPDRNAAAGRPYAFTNSSSSVIVTSSLTITPPVSSAALKVSP